MWEYRAAVIRILDADTFDLHVDVGLDAHRDIRVRLVRVQAAELGDPGGVEALGLTADLLTVPFNPAAVDLKPQWPLRVRTIKQDTKLRYGDKLDSFRRYLAEVWNSDGTNINDALLASPWAVPYAG